jgi:Na+/H+ antiporter NhaC
MVNYYSAIVVFAFSFLFICQGFYLRHRFSDKAKELGISIQRDEEFRPLPILSLKALLFLMCILTGTAATLMLPAQYLTVSVLELVQVILFPITVLMFQKVEEQIKALSHLKL